MVLNFQNVLKKLNFKELKKKKKRSSSPKRHKSRHRDSRRRKHRRRRSRSHSSDSYERRRRRRYRRRSSSSGSRDRRRSRHHRKSRKSRRHSSSSSSSSQSSSSPERRRERSPKASDLKSKHPYFSRLSKIRRERLNEERKERFWDGFQWVSKESLELANKDPTAHMKKIFEKPPTGEEKKEEKIVTGKDLRRVVATNLPLHYGIDQEDLSRYLIQKCKEKGHDILFRSIFLNYEQNSGIIECMEKEQTDILIKLDGEVLADNTLRFTKVADEKGFIYGGDSEALMQDSAQLTAQAAAIVNSRIRGLQGKGNTNENINLMGDSFSTTKPSKIIKIMNAHDRYEDLSLQKFQEMYEDMSEMMLQFGQFSALKIIQQDHHDPDSEDVLSQILSELGSVFVEFETEEEAKRAKDELKGKIYDGREVRCIFVPEKVYSSLNLK